MSSVEQDLNEAFAGESQAFQKYRAFAKKAARDGFPNIAKLFRTTSEAESIHAAGLALQPRICEWQSRARLTNLNRCIPL
jgi:rubrerythrin